MIGSGTPSSQSSAPRPKPMASSSNDLSRAANAYALRGVPRGGGEARKGRTPAVSSASLIRPSIAGHCVPLGALPSFSKAFSRRSICLFVSSRWFLRPVTRSRWVADWIHEVKHDGYRMLVIRENHHVRLLSCSVDDVLPTQMTAPANRKAPPSATSASPGQFDLRPKPAPGLSGSSVSSPERRRILPLNRPFQIG
jgi:hypothetical protein